MMTALREFRLATTEDIPHIAHVLVDTWRETFVDRLPSDFLNDMTFSRQETRHRRTSSKPERFITLLLNPEPLSVLQVEV